MTFQEQAELSDVEDAFGFSRIIQTISESRKLVVGKIVLWENQAVAEWINCFRFFISQNIDLYTWKINYQGNI